MKRFLIAAVLAVSAAAYAGPAECLALGTICLPQRPESAKRQRQQTDYPANQFSQCAEARPTSAGRHHPFAKRNSSGNSGENPTRNGVAASRPAAGFGLECSLRPRRHQSQSISIKKGSWSSAPLFYSICYKCSPAFGSGPKRLSPRVPSIAVNTNSTTVPITGISISSCHQPERSVSCKRRVVTAIEGKNTANK